MSTADELTKMIDGLTEAYDAIGEAGGTVPENKNYANLAVAIESIPSGDDPMANAYAILYTPNSDLEPDWVDDPATIRAIMNGSSYLPNAKGHTNLKFTKKCQELTDIVRIGQSSGSTPTTLTEKATTIEGLSNFTEVTSIGNYFMGNARISATLEFITDWPEKLRTIGTYFLIRCSLFNQPLPFMKNIRSISNYFLYFCESFNQPIDFPINDSGQPFVPANFMQYCYSFNQPFDFTGVESIGADFLREGTSFNQPIELPDQVRIGQSFLVSCTSFNQPIELKSTMTIGRYFLSSCSSFNQKITIPDGWTSIPEYFLSNCTSFDQPIEIPASVTAIDGYFLRSCSSFNSPITYLGEELSIGAGFLSICRLFNQPLDFLPKVKSDGDNFLSSCESFNQPLVFNDSITQLSVNFLYHCYAFNSTIKLPANLKTIGQYFMADCRAFVQPLAIPNTVTSIGIYFMNDCRNFVGPLDVGSTRAPSNSNYNLATGDKNALMYTTGVTITGENAQTWKDAMPDRDSSPYRKLIVKQDSGWDPENPTIEGLKYAINNGIEVEPGTEIPDTWNGESNPLIVAQKLDSSNNAAYGGAEGVICVRKYVMPESYGPWGGTRDYTTASIRDYLDGDYLNQCSDALKGVLSEISFQWLDRARDNTMHMLTNKWFLMSVYEVCGLTDENNGELVEEGVMWDYWKKQTGLTSPSYRANSGRIPYTKDGVATIAWTRTQEDTSSSSKFVALITQSGWIGGNYYEFAYGILPCCFIAKD